MGCAMAPADLIKAHSSLAWLDEELENIRQEALHRAKAPGDAAPLLRGIAERFRGIGRVLDTAAAEVEAVQNGGRLQ